MLLPDADLAREPQVAQLICAAVRALGIGHAHTSVAPGVTVSIGVVCAAGFQRNHGGARQRQAATG
ncbi:MAG: hypothetical protein ACOYNF_13055 [Rhodoferax sp.]